MAIMAVFHLLAKAVLHQQQISAQSLLPLQLRPPFKTINMLLE